MLAKFPHQVHMLFNHALLMGKENANHVQQWDAADAEVPHSNPTTPMFYLIRGLQYILRTRGWLRALVPQNHFQPLLLGNMTPMTVEAEARLRSQHRSAIVRQKNNTVWSSTTSIGPDEK